MRFANWLRLESLVRYFSRGAVPIDGAYVEPPQSCDPSDRLRSPPRTSAERVRIRWVVVR
jgi:hypothetical protein